jgi:hypothetical protein
VWQNIRSGQLGASGRSHALTSTPSMTRPSAPRGSANPASVLRNRLTSIPPQFKPSYSAP